MFVSPSRSFLSWGLGQVCVGPEQKPSPREIAKPPPLPRCQPCPTLWATQRRTRGFLQLMPRLSLKLRGLSLGNFTGLTGWSLAFALARCMVIGP